jgi:hypothetical protein
MINNTVIFSPHYDDAALSLGGALLNRMLGSNISIVDVFTISNYAPACNIDNFMEITGTRYMEEEQVMQKLKLPFESWKYPTPKLRGKDSFVAENSVGRNEYLNDELYEEISKRIHDYCAVTKDKRYFFPLGIGNHRDHLMVFNIGQELLNNDPSAEIFFYEDLPYSGGFKLDELIKQINLKDGSLIPFLLKFSNIDDKIDLLKAYKSQFIINEKGYVYLHTSRRQGEVVWSYKDQIDKLSNSMNFPDRII